ncbi:Uncharacterised protein [Nocardia africana]|uniref:Uncharacterized protein n=1 Tax=Nocardia africana TaxID=134964 RepID=A0A378WUW9_9NOCA|nr:Uncharacterised protein [Nocardia africana]
MPHDDASPDHATPDEMCVRDRLAYLLLEIEAAVVGGTTLEGGVRTAFECFFDVVDDRFLADALADRRRPFAAIGRRG